MLSFYTLYMMYLTVVKYWGSQRLCKTEYAGDGDVENNAVEKRRELRKSDLSKHQRK